MALITKCHNSRKHSQSPLTVFEHALTYIYMYNLYIFLYRSDWSQAQSKIFNKVYKVLAAARLSKLANSGVINEPILRRLSADKNARRIRQIFSNACWVNKLFYLFVFFYFLRLTFWFCFYFLMFQNFSKVLCGLFSLLLTSIHFLLSTMQISRPLN